MRTLVELCMDNNPVEFRAYLDNISYSENIILELPNILESIFTQEQNDCLQTLLNWLQANSYCSILKKDENEAHYYYQELWDNRLTDIFIIFFDKIKSAQLNEASYQQYKEFLKVIALRAPESKKNAELLKSSIKHNDLELVQFFYERLLPLKELSAWNYAFYEEDDKELFEFIHQAGFLNYFEIADYLLSLIKFPSQLNRRIRAALKLASDNGNIPYFKWTWSKLKTDLELKQKRAYIESFKNFVKKKQVREMAEFLQIDISDIEWPTQLYSPPNSIAPFNWSRQPIEKEEITLENPKQALLEAISARNDEKFSRILECPQSFSLSQDDFIEIVNKIEKWQKYCYEDLIKNLHHFNLSQEKLPYIEKFTDEQNKLLAILFQADSNNAYFLKKFCKKQFSLSLNSADHKKDGSVAISLCSSAYLRLFAWFLEVKNFLQPEYLYQTAALFLRTDHINYLLQKNYLSAASVKMKEFNSSEYNMIENYLILPSRYEAIKKLTCLALKKDLSIEFLLCNNRLSEKFKAMIHEKQDSKFALFLLKKMDAAQILAQEQNDVNTWWCQLDKAKASPASNFFSREQKSEAEDHLLPTATM